jgi:glycosyltransferase involved in cell wall biosynthesis
MNVRIKKMNLVILTTTYNCQDYVEKCLATIMTQTYKNFRCFIADDMSTDNTVDIIKKTESKAIAF